MNDRQNEVNNQREKTPCYVRSKISVTRSTLDYYPFSFQHVALTTLFV